MNATVQADPAGNRKLSKIKSAGRIDGMVALAMAMSVAGTFELSEPEIEPRIRFA
jgi:phage terminase large subunit-like protein